VSTKKEILINDSCILFDLLDLGLIKDYFQLEYQMFTTKEVIKEIKDAVQLFEITNYISSGNLKVDQYGSLESIQSLFDEYPGLSYTDCSVLELAIRKNGIVLSADKSLRNISIKRKLTVKGFLWIIAELVEKNLISPDKALKTLRLYPKVNKRVPIKEIKKMIDRLERDSL